MHRSTEQILNAIVNIIAKRGVKRNGNSWARITNRYLAQKIHCTEQTITNQTKKIIELGILKKNQFDLDKLDRTNSWAINFDNPNLFNLLEEYKKQKTFFSVSIPKTVFNIYNNININHNKSQEFFEVKKQTVFQTKKCEVVEKTLKTARSTEMSSKLNNQNYVK